MEIVGAQCHRHREREKIVGWSMKSKETGP